MGPQHAGEFSSSQQGSDTVYDCAVSAAAYDLPPRFWRDVEPDERMVVLEDFERGLDVTKLSVSRWISSSKTSESRLIKRPKFAFFPDEAGHERDLASAGSINHAWQTSNRDGASSAPGSDASIDRDDIVERLERASDPKAEERGIRIDRPHEYGAHSNGAASERYRCAITPKPVWVPTGSGVRWL